EEKFKETVHNQSSVSFTIYRTLPNCSQDWRDKSSVLGFGSDQFDESNKEEKAKMITLFNWFFFFISIGPLAAVMVLVYIQDKLGRRWGYGIVVFCIGMGLVFLEGGSCGG
ncbi:NRT1/ PTR family 6.3-like protein, partial [Tanacetum coccineum]